MKIASVLFLLLFPVLAYQQAIKPGAALQAIPFSAEDFVGSDKFGNAYFISENVFIKLYEGKTLEYKKLSKGKIAKADIGNPLLLMLLYQSFNTVVLLDNQLNEIKEIDFSKTDIGTDEINNITVQAAGLASQNRLWIYDSTMQQIGLYDYNKNSYQILTAPLNGSIKYYESDVNDFQWIDENGARFSCDIYGKITALGKVAAFDQFRSVSGDRYLYLKDGKLHYFNLNGYSDTLIDFGEKRLRGFYYKDQILSIFTKEGITNYKITLP